MNLRCYYFDIK